MAWARVALAVFVIGGCTREAPEARAPPTAAAPSATIEIEPPPPEPAAPDECIAMANGTSVCSCDAYRQAIVEGISPEEPKQRWEVAAILGFDMCLIGDVAALPIQGAGSERYDEFLALDLSNIPSSLRPRGIATLGELQQHGYELVRAEGQVVLSEEDWAYTLELFEPPGGWADVAYVARLTSQSFVGSYFAVSLLVVTSPPRAIDLRDYVAVSSKSGLEPTRE